MMLTHLQFYQRNLLCSSLCRRLLHVTTQKTPNPLSIMFIPTRTARNATANTSATIDNDAGYNIIPVVFKEDDVDVEHPSTPYTGSLSFTHGGATMFDLASASPLAARLLNVPGVVQVMLTSGSISVNVAEPILVHDAMEPGLDTTTDTTTATTTDTTTATTTHTTTTTATTSATSIQKVWDSVLPVVLESVMDVCADLEGGNPFAAVNDVELAKQICGVQGAVAFDAQTWEEGSIEEEISDLLEEQIRPFVQDDGGDIQLISFEEHTGTVTVQLVGACSGCPSSASTLQGRVETLLKHYVTEVTSVRSTEDAAATTEVPFLGRDISASTANHKISVEEHMQRLYEEGIRNSVVWEEDEEEQEQENGTALK